jgi:hypothetical protein
MDPLKEFKELQINNYFSQNVDFDNIDVNKIKRELHAVLGEEPAIQLNYGVEKMIPEGGSEEVRIEKLETVSIFYTYDMYIGGQNRTIPVEKKYIVG